MAIGGSYNNKLGNGSSNGGSSRGRSYGLMLLLAFGAALLGVMILHKLRERRIFNLLIKEKDGQLFSLHLLLQKERDYTKEVKSKNEEMKAKIYSLRTKKMELDRRLLEMQSTIDSLKDEQRTMEIAIEEKQNEIKMLRAQDQISNEKENNQVAALVESLKQKEAEIEDLKRCLQNPENAGSVNNTAETEQKGKSGSEDNGERRIIEEGETAKLEDENGNKVGDQSVKDGVTENPTIEGQEHDKNEDSKDENVSLSLNIVANSTGAISRNMVGKVMDGEELKVEGDGQLGKHEKSQDEGEENPGSVEGGMKLEIRDGFEKNGKRGSVSDNVKGKRWRKIAKSRRLEKSGKLSRVTRRRSVRFYKDEHGDLKSRVKNAATKGGVLLGEDNRQLEGRKSDVSSFEMPKKGEVSINGDVKESGKHGGDDELFEEYKGEIDE